MKVLLSWLREFAPFEGEPQMLADELSDLGLGVEAMKLLGPEFKGVVLAKVLTLKAHPDADRIQLVEVDAGSGEAVQVCCGAFNMEVGDLVPLAAVGAVLPGGFEIGRRKMRGEWSNGMLCAPGELDLPGDDSGILILGRDADTDADADSVADPTPLGADLADYLKLESDVLYDLEVNPNRPDAMSVAGVARDLAARLKLPFAIPEPQVTELGAYPNPVAVEIHEPGFCRHFTVRTMVEVQVGDSPSWITRRLIALGMRPVNSLVDISNLVMLELGQPTHAFDADKIPGNKLGVRMAKSGEQLRTLDDAVRTLSPSDGVIVDGNDEVLSLAGVMGGASSEISDTTQTALVEAAFWDPMTISRTSRRLGLRSEASARFERGVDPEIAELALRRFAELAEQTGTAKLTAGTVIEHGNVPEPVAVPVRVKRANEMLGVELEAAQIKEFLEPMGFKTELMGDSGGNEPELAVEIPSWRLDSSTEIDVIEEIGRAYGFGRIAKVVPVIHQIGQLSKPQKLRHKVADMLLGQGLTEVLSLPFLAPEDLSGSPIQSQAIAVANPLVEEESVLRPSLLFGMLKVAAYNSARRITAAQVFEIGHVFASQTQLFGNAAGAASSGTAGSDDNLPAETEHLGVLLCGQETPAIVRLWQQLCASLGLTGTIGQQGQLGQLADYLGDVLHPGRCGELVADGLVVGVTGELTPELLAQFDLERPVVWLEADLGLLINQASQGAAKSAGGGYVAPSKFPSSDIDLAFVLPDDLPASALQDCLRSAAGENLRQLFLFDVFRSPELAADSRSLTFRLRFEAPDRTLTDAEVAEVRQACIDAAQKLGAELRTG